MSVYFVGRSWAFVLKTAHGNPLPIMVLFFRVSFEKTTQFFKLDRVVKQQVVYIVFTPVSPPFWPLVFATCILSANFFEARWLIKFCTLNHWNRRQGIQRVGYILVPKTWVTEPILRWKIIFEDFCLRTSRCLKRNSAGRELKRHFRV